MVSASLGFLNLTKTRVTDQTQITHGTSAAKALRNGALAAHPLQDRWAL